MSAHSRDSTRDPRGLVAPPLNLREQASGARLPRVLTRIHASFARPSTCSALSRAPEAGPPAIRKKLPDQNFPLAPFSAVSIVARPSTRSRFARERTRPPAGETPQRTTHERLLTDPASATS